MNYVPFSHYQTHLESEHATYMAKVYFWMTLSMAYTSYLSMFIHARSDLVQIFFDSPWLLIASTIGQIIFYFLLQRSIKTLGLIAIIMFAFIYATINAINLSAIFLVLTLSGIYMAFIPAVAGFAGLFLFESITKHDLNGLTAFLLMLFFCSLGIIGLYRYDPSLLIPAVSKLYALFGSLIFAILVAFDVQKVKSFAVGLRKGYDEGPRSSLHGALALYLDFVNLFFVLILLMGDRRK